MHAWTTVVGAALLASCAATPNEPFGPEWFACMRNSQCELVEDPADCARIPVNRRYAERFEQRLSLEAVLAPQRIACDDNNVKYSGVCISAQCSSSVRGLRRR